MFEKCHYIFVQHFSILLDNMYSHTCNRKICNRYSNHRFSWCFFLFIIYSNSQVEFSVVTSNNVLETASFKWGLWITQGKCDGKTSLESPKGCFQYFLTSSGYLTSFAFDPNGQYLNNQVCSPFSTFLQSIADFFKRIYF